MAQADYIVANGTGAAVRSDLNGQLAAIVSNNSGATEPATMYAYQWWADTTAGLLKIRNAANNAWITLRELDGTLLMEDGTAAAPGLSFASDLDSGIFRGGANEFGIATNGVERVEFGTGEVVFNDGGANYDFRIEGDTNANLFFVDASAEAVGIGTASPSSYANFTNLTIQGGSSGSNLDFFNSSGVRKQAIVANVSNGLSLECTDAGAINFNTNGTERARIDSSGRLLVGTSASPSITDGQYAKLHVIGNSNSATGNGFVNIGRGQAASGALGGGTSLGVLQFTDNAGAVHAAISGDTDATTGTNDYPGRLVFSTTADGASSPTERMRISSDGHTYWGVANPGTTAFGTAIGRGGSLGFFQTARNVNGTAEVAFFHGNAGEVRIFGDGDLENTNNRYTGISDVKFKQNIEDASSQWDDLKAIRVRKYELIANPDRQHIGCVAQELETVCPGLVIERDGSSGESYKSVAYSVLYMKAVKALQEAMERIETLEASNTDLLARVAALEAN
jgi:hypothetical protein